VGHVHLTADPAPNPTRPGGCADLVELWVWCLPVTSWHATAKLWLLTLKEGL